MGNDREKRCLGTRVHLRTQGRPRVQRSGKPEYALYPKRTNATRDQDGFELGRGRAQGADKAIRATYGGAIPYVLDVSIKGIASFRPFPDTGTPIKSGLLYYTQTDSMHQVPAGMRDIRASLMLRKHLAQYTARQRVVHEDSTLEHGFRTDPTRNGTAYETYSASIRRANDAATNVVPAGDRQSVRPEVDLPGSHLDSGTDCYSIDVVPATHRERPILPPTINNKLECGRCFVSDTCMLYRRVCLTPHIADPVLTEDPRPLTRLSLIPETLSPSCTTRRLVI